MKSHITDSELKAIQQSGLDLRNAPAVIREVSHSQFSVARLMGCNPVGVGG